jgi:hypothetical protein
VLNDDGGESIMTTRRSRGKTAAARRPDVSAKGRGQRGSSSRNERPKAPGGRNGDTPARVSRERDGKNVAPCNRRSSGHPPLSPDQRRTVEKHLPLVTTCLEAFARRSKHARDRNVRWELFQEGCLGLMEAVARFRPESRRSFARFACSRILHGFRRWGRRQAWGGFRVYDSRAQRKRRDSDADPKVRSLDPSAVQFLRDHRRPSVSMDPDRPPCETIGERIGERMQRAAQCAVIRVEDSDDPPGSRMLAERILADRLMVPEEAQRDTLRGLARATGSPMGRVRRCDARLRQALREVLEEDGEVSRLRAAARRSRRGMSRPLDAGLQDRLRREEAEDFARRFHHLDNEGRLRFVRRWMAHGTDDLEAFLQRSWLTLGSKARDDLLQQLHRPRTSTGNGSERTSVDARRTCDDASPRGTRPVQPGV